MRANTSVQQRLGSLCKFAQKDFYIRGGGHKAVDEEGVLVQIVATPNIIAESLDGSGQGLWLQPESDLRHTDCAQKQL